MEKYWLPCPASTAWKIRNFDPPVQPAALDVGLLTLSPPEPPEKWKTLTCTPSTPQHIMRSERLRPSSTLWEVRDWPAPCLTSTFWEVRDLDPPAPYEKWRTLTPSILWEVWDTDKWPPHSSDTIQNIPT